MTEAVKNTDLMRFCAKCGNQTFTSDDLHRYYCTSCDFVMYMNAGGTVVGVIRDGNGRILMTRRGKAPAAGMLDLPGGFIDHFETAEDALYREIREELSLDVETHQFLFSSPNRYLYRDVLYHTIDFFFLCTVKNPNAIVPNEEIQDYVFLAPNEIDFNEIGFDSINQGIGTLKDRVRQGVLVL